MVDIAIGGAREPAGLRPVSAIPMPSPPPERPTIGRPRRAGCNPILGLILFLVVALFAYFTLIETPIDAPDPAKTGIPPTAPSGR
jgi:hypothetical protein